MSILDNAVSSIQLGIDDFQQIKDNPDRVYSSMRNLFAGILLLFKYKLASLSPADSDEILIKESVQPIMNSSGEVIWVGKGNKTVTVNSIKERFKNLDIEVDWNSFDKANNIRNNIEHYFENSNIDSIRNVLSKLFPIMRDFIIFYLDKNPQELIGDEFWNILVKEAQIYIEHKEICQSSLRSLKFFNKSIENAITTKISCPKCDSECILPDLLHSDASTVSYVCQSCQEELSYEEIIAPSINDYYTTSRYLAIKDGGDDPLYVCPECCRDLYIYEEGMCSFCGHEANHICPMCDNSTDLLDEICSYCQYKINNY